MPTIHEASAPWLLLGAYTTGLVSALVPWVNAEALLVSGLAVIELPGSASLLVVGVTAGQMTGKSVIYWVFRAGGRVPQGRLAERLARWRERWTTRPVRTRLLMFVSAVVGIPPFYVVSVAAGACMVAFADFLVIGLAGRLIHFAFVAQLPHLWRAI